MKPLADLTDDERAALVGPELWWYALQVMGYEVEELYSTIWRLGVGCGRITWYADTGLSIRDIDDWQLFGLAVEWIEARGCAVSIYKHWGPNEFWSFGAHDRQMPPPCCYGNTLPDAAARWIVEHGHKIAKERET